MPALLTALAFAAACTVGPDTSATRLEQIQLPPGFQIDVYAADVPNARSMARAPGGTLFVGTRAGAVYAVVDEDDDARADRVYTIAEGLRMPNGVAVRDGDLYVAEISRILRYDDIEARLTDVPEPVVVYDDLPSDEWHGWKYIGFGPDGKLYVPVGAPCNVCEREEPYAGILRMNPDGTGVEMFAHGVRNSVGLAWHPTTGELWFTDNGRDNISADPAVTDTMPPDELNRAPRAGLHFGFPYIHAGTISDPEFGTGHRPEQYTPPARPLSPHGASLGLEFYTGEMFPAEYRGQLFIAEHGSWNRTEKLGYRLMLARLDGAGNVLSYEPFATGWLQDEESWGRPVDVEQLPDGSLLLSDDQAGTIYRITYGGS